MLRKEHATVFIIHRIDQEKPSRLEQTVALCLLTLCARCRTKRHYLHE
jgi:hypothetical protein